MSVQTSPTTKPYDIVIIGGGASGLTAAIMAARAYASSHAHQAAHIAILESDSICGRKILATGNGRCNYSNKHLTYDHYYHDLAVRKVFETVCQSRDFKNLIGSNLDTQDASIENIIETFFSNLGLVSVNHGNFLYPYSLHAESVRETLLAACQSLDITLLCNHTVQSLSQTKSMQWKIGTWAPTQSLVQRKNETDRKFKRRIQAAQFIQKDFFASCVIISAGNSPISSQDSFLRTLPIKLEKPQPILCPIACLDKLHCLKDLDGQRILCKASIIRNGHSIYSERGELLFRSYGISGILAFNLSRRIQSGDTISLNLVPDWSTEKLDDYISWRLQNFGEKNFFRGFTNTKVGTYLSAYSNLYKTQYNCTTKEALYTTLTQLELLVNSTCEHQHAQVIRGGISLDNVNLSQLSFKQYPHLFACGEALDIDADCGGFNLSWAWISGALAGYSSAQNLFTVR